MSPVDPIVRPYVPVMLMMMMATFHESCSTIVAGYWALDHHNLLLFYIPQYHHNLQHVVCHMLQLTSQSVHLHNEELQSSRNIILHLGIIDYKLAPLFFKLWCKICPDAQIQTFSYIICLKAGALVVKMIIIEMGTM